MPKVGMEPIRRAEAINAALECICEFGIDSLTLDKVADKAGFSKGIAAYYFKTKNELIAESMRAFLSAYRQKIAASLSPDMRPQQRISTVVEVSLPLLGSGDNDIPINVSPIHGADKIALPEKKIARLFIQFFSKAALDDRLRDLINEAYAEDVRGIAQLIGAAQESRDEREGKAATQSAYGLLAIIVGLSFFRVISFQPPGETDNQAIALDYMFKIMAK